MGLTIAAADNLPIDFSYTLYNICLTPDGCAVQAPEFMDTQTAANYLGLKPQTLSAWRCSGRYRLPFLKVGRKVLYKKTDIDAWIGSRTRTNTAMGQCLLRCPPE
jgi:excisionase family DNA binding protein